MSWSYDPEKSLFLPSITLREITQGNAGQTIAIPVAPPTDSGFEVPPIPLPPPVPPLPVPPLDWTQVGTVEFISIQKVYRASVGDFLWTPFTAAQIEMDSGYYSSCMGNFMLPVGYAGVVIIEPIFRMTSSTGDIVITHHLYYAYEGQSSIANYADFNGGNNYVYTPGDTLMKIEFPIQFTAIGGEIIQIYFHREGAEAEDTSPAAIRPWGWRVIYT
jgi:hypothetical protein